MLIFERGKIADFFGTFFDPGYVVIEGDRIAAVGPGPAPDVPGAIRLDLHGRLLTPSLVNAHAHLYSSLARGIPLKVFNPTRFGEILEQLWWKLDRALDLDGVYHSARVGALDHLRSGVTVLFDHHASPSAIEGSLSAIKRAVAEVGLRADLCYEVTDRGGLTERDQGLEENVRFAREEADGKTFSAHMGLHASFTLSDETLSKAAAAAEPLKLAFHTHLAEGTEDPTDAVQKYRLRTAERLDRFGILTSGTLLIHGIHLSPAELDLLAARPATVVHNPRSNMNNAVGAAPVSTMLARGIQVALGTDGFGTDMLGELLAARLLAHHASGSPTTLSDAELLSLWRHNYALAGQFFGVPFGKLAPGYAADLVVWNYTPPTPLHAGNLLGHFLFGHISGGLRPDIVVGQGRVLLRDGRVETVDEKAVLAQARVAAERLWSKM